MDYDISISTCNRNPLYVHDTIRCLQKTTLDPIRLYVSGDNDDYLKQWKGLRNVLINVSPNEFWQSIKDSNAPNKCNANMWFALDQADKEKHLLFLEDDIELCDNWVVHLETCIHKANHLAPEGWVISLFYGYVLPGDILAHYPAKDYYGTQALLISKKVLPLMTEVLREGLGKSINPDMLIQDFLKANPQYQLFGTVPHLAQHMGAVSTGCGGIPKSTTYVKEY